MSRELDRIYSALIEGKQAAEALMTWQRGADGRDIVRSRQSAIQLGLDALETLRRDLRDGRKHIDTPDDHDIHRPRPVNLTEASEGYRLCDTCNGEGVGMEMKCYGGDPVEQTVQCPDCDGEGEVEDDTASGRAQRTNNGDGGKA